MPPDSADVDRTGPDGADVDSAGQSAPDGLRRIEGGTAVAVDDWEDRWRRALADLDNLRKRHARELRRAGAAERAHVAAAFLPVVDNLELALAHADADPASIVDGVRAVRDQAVAVLARLGYPRHDETGVPFDPASTRSLRSSTTPTPRRAPSCRCCGPATATPSGSCGRPPSR